MEKLIQGMVNPRMTSVAAAILTRLGHESPISFVRSVPPGVIATMSWESYVRAPARRWGGQAHAESA